MVVRNRDCYTNTDKQFAAFWRKSENEGRFNGHECICVMSDDFGIEHGQCVKILNQVFLRAPACDGPLREFSGELIKDRECGGRDPQG